MTHPTELPSDTASLGELVQLLTVEALRRVGHDPSREILCKLDAIADLIIRGHRAEMDKIDAETDELAKQLEAIAAEVTIPDQVARLNGLAATLNGIGKPPGGPPSP